MSEPTVEVTVGKVGRAHGLRGDLFVDLRTDEPERRFAAGVAFETPRGRLVVESTRWQGRRMLVRFEQAHDREAAERLRGLELSVDVPAEERPDDPEEFYDHQLRGLAAVTSAGERVGVVTEVLHVPSQDLLVVEGDTGEVLVPFVADIVSSVDLAGGRLEIVELPGLLEPGS